MTIDPTIAALMAMAQPADPAEALRPVAERRDAIEADFGAMMAALQGRTFDDVTIVETTVPGPYRDIPVRVFRPSGVDGALPALLYFFGGGFWMRSYNSPDIVGACRQISCQARVVVVEIDYALAPEHPFPAAIDEGLAVLAWMATGAGEHLIDPARLAVGGQSAGGGLSASIAIRARDEGGPAIALQVLEVPGIDLSFSQFVPPPAPYTAEDLAGLVESIEFYLPEGMDSADPAVSPISVADLSGLPPALVINAEYDPLRPSGERFAARLREAGVPVVSTTYGGQVHNSPGLPGISAASRAWREQVSWAVSTMHGDGGVFW